MIIHVYIYMHYIYIYIYIYIYRRLSGKGGATIQKIQKESSVRIAVKQDQELVQDGVVYAKVCMYVSVFICIVCE